MSRKKDVLPLKGAALPQKITSSILFLDIKGYSKLDDNKLGNFIIHALPEIQSVIGKRIYNYINTWGDAIVIAADDVREITHIAMDLRDFFYNFDWPKYSLPILSARISLHHGTIWKGADVFTNRGMISGQTVNLAARIETVTEPGKVWATKDFIVILGREIQTLFKSNLIGEHMLPKDAGQEELYILYRYHEKNPLSKGREVSIAIVVKDKMVLLVRCAGTVGPTWQFPAGQIKPLANPEDTAVEEVFEETNVRCKIIEKISEREHPDTGVYCRYFRAEWQSGEAHNKDAKENNCVEWVSPLEALSRFTTHVEPAVKRLLETL